MKKLITKSVLVAMTVMAFHGVSQASTLEEECGFISGLTIKSHVSKKLGLVNDIGRVTSISAEKSLIKMNDQDEKVRALATQLCKIYVDAALSY